MPSATSFGGQTCPTATGEASGQSNLVLDREASESPGYECTEAQEGNFTTTCGAASSDDSEQATELSFPAREAFQLQLRLVRLERFRFGVVWVGVLKCVREQTKAGRQATRQDGVGEEELESFG